MRAIEFILESVSDTRDIHLASQWLADRIIGHRIPNDRVFTTQDLFKMDGGDTLPIDHGPLSEILIDDDLMFMVGDSRTSSRGTKTNGSFFPNKNLIWINGKLRQRGVASMASTIGHELRHALDFSLSSGKPFRTKGGKPRNATTAEYLRDPQEINARFTQALWAMAFDTIERKPATAHDALRIIDDCLHRLQLDRELFPDGPTGDKRYNRLRSRAIRYWSEVARFLRATEAEDVPRRTLMDRIRSIVSKFRGAF